jgi:hypothetical protein
MLYNSRSNARERQNEIHSGHLHHNREEEPLVGVLTPLVAQVIPSINMVACGYKAWELGQIFSRAFASFVVVDIVVADVAVVVDTVVVVEFEQELQMVVVDLVGRELWQLLVDKWDFLFE